MRLLVGLAVLLLTFPALAGEPRFFDDLGDVPVMPQLAEVAERAVVFDKPSGRIAQATARASSGVQMEDIRQFYAEALPQFGWRGAGPGRYVREDQVLSISDAREGGRILVVFRLEPR